MQKSFAVKSYTLHLNRSASDPLVCCTIKLQKFRPLKRVGLPRRPEAIGPREGKEGEQHAENLGLVDALRGGARAHLLNELDAKMAVC